MTLRPINGADLWIEDSGGPGQPILFSHGLLFRTDLFAPQVAALSATHRCVAYDHRGQGRSERTKLSSIPMELLYQDAVGIIETLALGPVHFVGLSMGGFVGMRLAARRPDLVRSLVLLDTSADPEPEENVLKYRAMSSYARVFGIASLLWRVMPIMFGRSNLEDPSRAADREAWKRLLLLNDRSIYRAVNGVIDRIAIRPELDRITCPTLVAVGEEDVATVPAKAERIHAAIRGSKLVRIPRAGHSSTLEQPEAVTAAIRSHIA